MFWSEKIVLIILLSVWLAGCKSENKAPDAIKNYFDIRGFFNSEATRLGSKNPIVLKTVSDNRTPERKKVRIADWQNELELFSESDINKASWKDSYNTKKDSNTVIYTAREAGLRTRKIRITKSPTGKTSRIQIENKAENMLYTSVENLDYYPDSLYIIDKFQKVRILGPHKYLITGKLK
ncbi:MAG TPA: hypothetical protein VGC08_09890 [Pedobacter sp.]